MTDLSNLSTAELRDLSYDVVAEIHARLEQHGTGRQKLRWTRIHALLTDFETDMADSGHVALREGDDKDRG